MATMHEAPSPLDRRALLSALGASAAGFAGAAALTACAGGALEGQQSPLPAAGPAATPEAMGWDPRAGQYVLPPLPYAFDALEPHLDEQTLRLHHGKHHAAYVKGLNGALEQLKLIRSGQSKESVQHWSRQLAFHGSGHFLHVVFWSCMAPGGSQPSGALAERLRRDFGSFAEFTAQFKAAANAVEGGGWGILVLEPVSGQLMVMQAEKHQDLTAWGVVPLVAVDVWEHAYYLKYQNRRAEYVDAFMNVVNWSWAGERYASLAAR
jgi:Fe-Mn family superoxide dismutase